jgi:hypothetical protein
MNWCRKEIKFIQGDVLEYYFDFGGRIIPPEVIAHVYFSCAGENLLIDLTYSPEQRAYCLRLTSEETLQLTPMFCTYDVSVEMIDGNKLTILHDCSFVVLRKRNSWVAEHYEEYDEEEAEEENEDDNAPNEPEEPEEGDEEGNDSDVDDNITSEESDETEENENNGDENNE